MQVLFERWYYSYKFLTFDNKTRNPIAFIVWCLKISINYFECNSFLSKVSLKNRICIIIPIWQFDYHFLKRKQNDKVLILDSIDNCYNITKCLIARGYYLRAGMFKHSLVLLRALLECGYYLRECLI